MSAASPEKPPIQTEGPKTEHPLSPPKGNGPILQFDKDGFPIVATLRKSNPAVKTPIAMTFAEASPAPEPPTVIFDENGFPLNPPDEDSMNTLLESPKTKATANSLTKNDK